MDSRLRVLLVSSSGGVARTLAADLSAAGYECVLASDFTEARAVLERRPSLLITDLKLGAFNGLHLAIRAGAIGTPAVVIGDADSVLEADARRQRAIYLTLPVDGARVVSIVGEILDAAKRQRRSPRKRVPDVEAFAGDVHGRLVEVSYEGMRIEAESARRTMFPPDFIVRLPDLDFECRVQCVWTAPCSENAELLCCGVTLLPGDDAAMAWRSLVDTLPPLSAAAH